MKCVTWQALGVLTMTALSYPHTGSLAAAVTLAVSSCSLGFVTFFLHERVWSRIRWGMSLPSERDHAIHPEPRSAQFT
ncbi:DUF2061 domain-containing protein [Roseibium sediminis]|uniref:DUF2061 domain-containing protein n=1 Tax=Roseibium sediminis TaxID=1775174 RepID=UPI001AD8DA5D|nr:DUF2061 domain-containing protein [Roseibium sediminis]